MRTVRLANVVAMVVFALLVGVAMGLYPGGTWHDRSVIGHDFWFNFLCDLLHERALGGGDNHAGAGFATAGMLAMVVGMTLHWFVVSARLSSRTVRRLVILAGLASSLGAIAVALTPSNRFPSLHTASLSLALGGGAVATTLGALSLARAQDTPRWLGTLALLTWGLLIAGSAAYVHHTWFAGNHLRLLPAIQRAAAVVAALYIVGCALHPSRPRTSPSEQR